MPTAIRLVDLGEPRAQDRHLVGGKAAMLARALAAGLPVLPGYVVPAVAAEGAFAAGTAGLAAGGSGRARLAVMATTVDSDLIAELTARIGKSGWPVVVRSSSIHEHAAEWAGAFSSFAGVGPDDLATALRGVWASAFTVDALERSAAAGLSVGDLGLAVLVQPELAARAGGVARVRPDGGVEMSWARGGPQGVLSGYGRGAPATVTSAGHCEGPAVDAFGAGPVAAVAGLASRVADALGADLIEWAWQPAGPVLLQATRGAVPPPVAPSVPPAPGLESADALRIARLARRYPGPLGEELVLSWGLGSPVEHLAPDVDRLASAVLPAEALQRAVTLAGSLIAQAWQRPPELAASEATALLREIRGPQPGSALRRSSALSPVDPRAAAELLTLIDDLIYATAAAKLVPSRDEVWQHPAGELRQIIAARQTPPPVRVGPDRWEPFLYGVVTAQGQVFSGTPAAAGVGAGAARAVRDVRQRYARRSREVIVAPHPIPQLASRLWTASALVTGPGDVGAHLVEVATSLGVPAVVDVDVDRLLLEAEVPKAQGELLLAVDGVAGRVWTLHV